MTTTVFCTFRQVGFHNWPKAPNSSSYLRSVHRHEFHVRVEVFVSHGDRDVEFIEFKQTCISNFESLGEYSAGQLSFGAQSCEHLATRFLKLLVVELDYKVAAVEVSEDGENGARVEV